MSAHTTLHISSSAALKKLQSIDWEDVPKNIVERVLDVLLYDTLYNFYIVEHIQFMEDPASVYRSIDQFDVPSLGKEEYYSLSEDQRRTFDRLKGEGYSPKEILTLIRSRHER